MAFLYILYLIVSFCFPHFHLGYLNPNYYKKHQHNICCRWAFLVVWVYLSFHLQFVLANLVRNVPLIWCDPAGRFDLTFLTMWWEDSYVLGCLEDSALKSWHICQLIATQLTSENPLNVQKKKEVKWCLVQQFMLEGVFRTIAQKKYYTTHPYKTFLLWLKLFFGPIFLFLFFFFHIK